MTLSKMFGHGMVGLVTLGLTTFFHPAQAETSWPDRTIKWIVPYLAGTAPDSTARLVAEYTSKLLNETIVIENKPGAAGNIGARYVAKSKPDGYTWLYSAGPMGASMVTYKEPGYDAVEDFEHITQVAASDVLLISSPNSGIKTVEELIDAIKQEPDKYTYASGGVGTPSHLGVEQFLYAAGIESTHIPYKGASEIVNAVISEQVEFGMPIFSVAYPQVKAGKLHALAVGGEERNFALPDTPTLKESGVDVSLSSWGGVSVAKHTPKEITEKIRQALHEVLKKPKVIKALNDIGSSPKASTNSKEYIALFEQEEEQTKRMMDLTGLKAQ